MCLHPKKKMNSINVSGWRVVPNETLDYVKHSIKNSIEKLVAEFYSKGLPRVSREQ